MGELVLCIPTVAPDLRAEAITVFGLFHQTSIIIITIMDIPLLYHSSGFLVLGNLLHRAIGINRQMLAQVAVGIIVKLLFMRSRTLEQGMQYLVVGIVTVTGLPPAAVVNHPHIMGAVILPAPVDRRGLWRKMRVTLCQRFPEELGSLPC